MAWPFRRSAVDGVITKAVDDYLASDRFAAAIRPVLERTVISIIRSSPDEGLTQIGFILKIAVCIFDAAKTMPWGWAKKQAGDIYRQFCKDSGGVKFGEPGWDWTGAGARTLAREYEIEYWD